MNLNNLVFFDKNGESYNFTQTTLGYLEGADYFLPISTALFDCSNIFVLENISDNVYKFPEMEPGSKFEIKWKTRDSSANFFLYTINRETVHSDSTTFIETQESITINYSDFGQISGNLDLTYPMQINIAFNPIKEQSYSRVMQMYYTIGNTSTLILEMTFYGEGEDEDERYRIWLTNFGIKFNREDALLLKDYDLKESLPDWQQINLARKNLLVNIDQVYPYVGTYKGLINLISILGYKDVLRVKEYWQDSDQHSAYYQKFAMVDITDLMQIGDLSNVNLVGENGQIKKGGKFKKTEFLALAYEFTVAGDTYDADGLPEVIETTDFSVDEIFFKLHGVAKKLKEEVLPINVLIKDIIGEFIYFDKFNLRDWSDTTFIEETQLNDVYKIVIVQPDLISTELKIRDLKSLYPKLDGVSEFPNVTFNIGQIEPYQYDQKYLASEISYLRDAVTSYYTNLTDYGFYRQTEENPTDSGDDTVNKIGCPIILEAYIHDLTLHELSGITFGDFILSEATTSSTMNSIGLGIKYFACANIQSFIVGSKIKATVSVDQSSYMEGTVTELGPIEYTANTIKVEVDGAHGNATSTGWVINLIDTHFTIGFLKYKNAYEMEWIIDGPLNYHFEWRAPVNIVSKIPHMLPHTGDYVVQLIVYDLQGGTSTDTRKITVSEDRPILEAFIKIQDKTRYDIKSLSNLTIGDLGNSPLYFPYATVINLNGENSPLSSIYSHYLDWYTYSHKYGVGSPQIDAQILNLNNVFEPISQSTESVKFQWGTGSANGQPTIADYSGARLKDLKFITFSEMGYTGDKLDGFYIDLMNLCLDSPASYLTGMQFGGFAEVDFPSFIQTPDDLLSYLQNNTLPGWREYSYQIFGDRIKATAKFQDKKNHSILKFIYTLSGVFNSIEYLPSSIDLVISSETIQLGICTVFQSQMIGPSGPGWTGPSGWSFPTIYSNTILKLGDRIRIHNSSGGFAEGFVISISDYDVQVDVDLIENIGDLSTFSLAIVDTVYTFERPIDVFDFKTLAKSQLTLAGADLQIDEDLMFLTCNFKDLLISNRTHKAAPASDIRYWIDLGFVTYDDVEELQTGYLPSSYDQNSLNMTHVRATYNTIIVPIYHPVFIIISNLTSNVETEWTLLIGSTQVAKIKTTSYFIWRFNEPGEYSLHVKSTDTRGNVSILDNEVKISVALTVDEYQDFVERQLTNRKYQMTHQ